jgi:hypothetical protein
MNFGPVDESDPVEMADYLELIAIKRKSGTSSLGDLESRVRHSGSGDAEDEPRRDILTETWSELEERLAFAGDGYPFMLSEDGCVSTKGSWRDSIPYVFCLVVSQVGFPEGIATQPAARLFEEICLTAAKGYVGGEAFRFGSPRDHDFSSFPKALGHVLHKLKEGEIVRPHEEWNPGDDGLDIVAWKDHLDGRLGKLLLFGQCAAGKNWRSKTNELRVQAFTSEWIPGSLVSPIVPVFFIPHLAPVSDAEFRHITLSAGIVFDRCRTAYWAKAAEEGGTIPDWTQHRGWVSTQLRGMSLQ